jgi:hypothetical protein
MVTIAVLFQGEPESGAELVHACLPGLLSYLASSGGKLADAVAFLEHPLHLVTTIEAADWPVDQNLLDILRRAEAVPILRQWSAILGTMVKHPVIGEELERRTAKVLFEDWDQEEDDNDRPMA